MNSPARLQNSSFIIYLIFSPDTSYAKEACRELLLSDLTSILYICTLSEKYQYFTLHRASYYRKVNMSLCGKRQVIDPGLMKTILNCHLPYHQLLLPLTSNCMIVSKPSNQHHNIIILTTALSTYLLRIELIREKHFSL